MSLNIVQEVVKLGTAYISGQTDKSVTLKKGELSLGVYDKENLVGFKLTGDLDGASVCIVHDTDNYSRSNPKYEYMYDDARKDALHVATQFLEDKITVKKKEEKKFFRVKQVQKVCIPNQKGQINEYEPLTVNTTNFFE